MNVLVVGGLGYIGSDLCDKLAKFATVTILDCNLFGSSYVPANGINVIPDNFIMRKLDIEEYDKFILLSDIDCEEFYKHTANNGYLSNYQRKIIELAESGKEVYYFYGYTEDQDNQREFMQDTVTKCRNHGNFIAIKTPIIYGDNVHVRGDLLINQMIRDFVMYEGFTLQTNPLEIIEFAHIFKYTDAIVDCVVNDKRIPDYDRLPAILLCNYIHWSLNEGGEYRVSIGARVANAEPILPTQIYCTDYATLNHNLNLMLQSIKAGVSTELMQTASDHGHTIMASIVGHNVTTKLLCP
jgi:hypothetical protein